MQIRQDSDVGVQFELLANQTISAHISFCLSIRAEIILSYVSRITIRICYICVCRYLLLLPLLLVFVLSISICYFQGNCAAHEACGAIVKWIKWNRRNNWVEPLKHSPFTAARHSTHGRSTPVGTSCPPSINSDSSVGKRINYSEKKARSCNNGWSILMSLRRSTHMDRRTVIYGSVRQTDRHTKRETGRRGWGRRTSNAW